MIKGIGRFDSAQHGFCIVTLCKGKTDEKDFYAFVAIEPQNYSYFKKDYIEHDGSASSFNAYGTELLRGWGATPPDDILDYVRDKYDVEFDVQTGFIERLVALSQSADAATSFPLKPAKAS